MPQREGVLEQRAWEAMLFSEDGDTGVELEMRLYDVQAQTRRLFLKRRDSGADRLLLLINDSQANRDVVRQVPDYLADLPRIRTAHLYAVLEKGDRPASCFALIWDAALRE